ncbi:hypothetical protein ACMAY9_03150 [Porticoccaceae bacterium nBUS_09]
MKIIIGDNPFFGVTHSGAAQALQNESERFDSARAVIAEFEGHDVKELMLTRHPAVNDLLDGCCIKDIHLVSPYPHFFNRLVASGGYLAIAKYFLPAIFSRQLISCLGSLLCLKPYRAAFRILISSELKSLGAHALKVRSICLHNIFTDMALAAQNKALIDGFIDTCKAHGLQAVVITQNLPALLELLDRDDFVACASINRLGYMTNPSLDRVEHALKTLRCKPKIWAMQILASGIDSPNDALDYLAQLKVIDGVLYATSKAERVSPFVAETSKYCSRN